LSPGTTTSPTPSDTTEIPALFRFGASHLASTSVSSGRQPATAPHFATGRVTTREAWRGTLANLARSDLHRAKVRARRVLAWRSVARHCQAPAADPSGPLRASVPTSRAGQWGPPRRVYNKAFNSSCCTLSNANGPLNRPLPTLPRTRSRDPRRTGRSSFICPEWPANHGASPALARRLCLLLRSIPSL
jgi:hypothetical protein